MKKLIILLLAILFSVQCSFSAEKWRNDSRTMFVNNQLVIFEINPRTFSAKDLNNNGIIELELGESSGNFIGAIDRLNELQKMGINAIHVMPIFPVGTHRALGTAGSLYALSDFNRINPQLDLKGNNLPVEQEFEIFVEECHKRDIRVIVDVPSCGAYDLFLQKPELFYKNDNNEAFSPSDWFDVYLFKTKNDDGTLNDELYESYISLFKMILKMNVDGVRVDVAQLKPYKFWNDIVLFARSRNPEFLFLAEASNLDKQPLCKQCDFTNYEQLLDAGFDGYYGSYFNYNSMESVNELKKQVKLDMSLSNKFYTQKSVIGSFTTHDFFSPILEGGYNYAVQVIWLNALLPLNPYYVDGIQSGDNYIYDYANKEAATTFTDNHTYYVHKGKMDIFNYSKQPKGDFPQLTKEIETALKFRNFANKVITKGKFDTIKTNNKEIFAFERKYEGKTIIVILNKNNKSNNKGTIRYKGFMKKDNFIVIKSLNKPVMKNNKVIVDLLPSEILILYSEK